MSEFLNASRVVVGSGACDTCYRNDLPQEPHQHHEVPPTLTRCTLKTAASDAFHLVTLALPSSCVRPVFNWKAVKREEVVLLKCLFLIGIQEVERSRSVDDLNTSVRTFLSGAPCRCVAAASSLLYHQWCWQGPYGPINPVWSSQPQAHPSC